MKKTKMLRRGFTLIELMFVVLVILMLSGLLFKLSAIIKDRSERAKAAADLQNIEHVLNEYFAEYGIYPPVQSITYEYEDTSHQPPSMDDPAFTNALGYSYGLVAHLYKRNMASRSDYRDDQYNGDTARDEAAKERWAHYLADIILSTNYPMHSIGSSDGSQVYSNQACTIKDPWNVEYQYASRPPYLSYSLWSKGPDGAPNTVDDLNHN